MDNNTNPVLTDFLIPENIADTISVMKFYPDQYSTPILASGSWDSKIRLWTINYQVNNNGNSAQFQVPNSISFTLPEPILSMSWKTGSPAIATGCADGGIHMIDLGSSGITQIGKHESGVQGIYYINENNANLIISAGWDSKLNIWDPRQPNPVFTYNLLRKPVSMSCTFPLLIIGMTERAVCYFNLLKFGNNFAPDAVFESHLKYATTVVTAFNEPNGYAIGSIEGRTAIKYLDLNTIPVITPENKNFSTNSDFAFRCHRLAEGNSQTLTEVYPVNAIAFNPQHGTFCTGGGDGTWLIWDKDSKIKLRLGTLTNKTPITALEYSADGNLLAYASGYDWHKGIEYSFQNPYKTEIRLHYLPDSEKKKKPKTNTGR